jgi:hypothetical protein
MTHVLYVPPHGDEEPVATLVYGDQRFEIGYTLFHWMAGIFAVGASQSGVDTRTLANVKAALTYIENAMCEDAGRKHADVPLPDFVLPFAEKTQYVKGHVPQPFNHRETLEKVLSDRVQALLWREQNG